MHYTNIEPHKVKDSNPWPCTTPQLIPLKEKNSNTRRRSDIRYGFKFMNSDTGAEAGRGQHGQRTWRTSEYPPDYNRFQNIVNSNLYICSLACLGHFYSFMRIQNIHACNFFAMCVCLCAFSSKWPLLPNWPINDY
jgi:hypothetical protein